MANEARGEFNIELEGVEYGMRPSYDAIVAFEGATGGKSLLELARAAANQTLSTTDAAIIVTECCKEWGRRTENKSAANFNERRVGELLMETGMLIVTKRLEIMLFVAATGGVTSTGEAKAMTTKETTTAQAPGPVSPASPQQRSTGTRKSSGRQPR